MNSATSSAMIAASVAAQTAIRNSSSSGGGAASDVEAPVIIALVCMCILATIVVCPLIQFIIDHPKISSAILVVVIIFCAMWYGACY